MCIHIVLTVKEQEQLILDKYEELYGNEKAKIIRNMEIELDKHFHETQQIIYEQHKQKLRFWPDAPLKHV